MEATPANQAGQPDVNQVSGRTAPECATPTRATPRDDASATVLPEAPVLEGQGEEVDVWWGSYAARTLTPSFILCGLLTLVVLGVALYLGAWHGTTLARYSAHALIGVIWVIQLSRWGYRVVAINYRLTTRHLYVERGFRHPGKPGIDFARVRQVLVTRNRIERWLGVGRVCIFLPETESPMVLEGVRDPERIASEIRKQLKRSGEQNRDAGGE